MKKTTDPPRLAIWLLNTRLSAEWRDFVIGDLEEEFATRRGDSPVAAHAWFWWQTMRCRAAPSPVRPNPVPLGSQGDSRMRTVCADRDQNSAWRPPIRCPSSADRRGHVTRARRRRGLNDRGARVGEGHGHARLRRERLRSADTCHCSGHAGVCRVHGQPGARVSPVTIRPRERPFYSTGYGPSANDTA